MYSFFLFCGGIGLGGIIGFTLVSLMAMKYAWHEEANRMLLTRRVQELEGMVSEYQDQLEQERAERRVFEQRESAIFDQLFVRSFQESEYRAHISGLEECLRIQKEREASLMITIKVLQKQNERHSSRKRVAWVNYPQRETSNRP